MAVKRQTRQFFNKPVGVVRANVGAQQVGQSIANAATQIANNAFQDAVAEGRKQAEDKAMSLSRQELVAINPDTNEPEVYTPPSGWGRIRQTAYQNIIDQRYESEIKTEIQTRAAEISKKSSSANQYLDSFTKYVGAMYNAEGEQTKFSRIISEYGTEYGRATFESRRQKEIAAQREALINADEMAYFQRDIQIQQALNAGTEVADLITQQFQSTQNRSEAGTLTQAQMRQRQKDFMGYNAVSANNELTGIYLKLPEEGRRMLVASFDKPELLQSIREEFPNAVGTSDIEKLLVNSYIKFSKSELQTGFNNLSKRQESLEEVQISSARSGIDINPNTSFSDLSSQLARVPEGIRDFVAVDAYSDFIVGKFDLVKNIEGLDFDVMSSVLMSSNKGDYSKLNEVFEPNVAAQVIQAIEGLTPEQRQAVEKEITDRRQSVINIGTAAAEESAESREGSVRSIAAGVALSLTEDEFYFSTRQINNLKSASIDIDTFKSIIPTMPTEAIDSLMEIAEIAEVDGDPKLIQLAVEQIVSSSESALDLRNKIFEIDEEWEATDREIAVNRTARFLQGLSETPEDLRTITAYLSAPNMPTAKDRFRKFLEGKGEVSLLKELEEKFNPDQLKDLREILKTGSVAETQAAADDAERKLKLEVKNLASELKAASTPTQINVAKQKSQMLADRGVAGANNLVNVADDKLVSIANTAFKSKGLSVNDLLEIQSFVLQAQPTDKANFTGPKAQLMNRAANFSLQAYNVRDGVSRDMATYIESREASIQREEEQRYNAQILSVSKQDPSQLSEDDTKRLDAVLANNAPVTFESIFGADGIHSQYKGIMQNGGTTPKLKAALTNAFMSGSPETLELLVNALNEFQSTEYVSPQNKVRESLNLARRNLSVDAYRMYAAAAIAGNGDLGKTISSLIRYNEVDSAYRANGTSLAKETKTMLGLSANDQFFADTYMPPSIRQELGLQVQMMVANGVPVNDSTEAAVLENYMETDFYSPDSAVVSTSIGGKVAFGRGNFYSNRELEKDLNRVQDLMVNLEDEELDQLLTGGTTIDQVLRSRLTQFSPIGLPALVTQSVAATIQRIKREFGSDPANINAMNRRQRLRDGLKVVTDQIMYRPIEGTFEPTENKPYPSYEYEIGFLDEVGSFEPFPALGTLKKDRTSDMQADYREIKNQQLFQLRKGDDDLATTIALAEYDAALHHVTDVDQFIEGNADVFGEGSIFSEEEQQQIIKAFNTSLKEYNQLGSD